MLLFYFFFTFFLDCKKPEFILIFIMSISLKKLSFFCLFLFTLSFVSADPFEGYWISYHLTLKYVQAAWHTYVTDKGTLQGDTVAFTEVRAEEAKAVGFKGKESKVILWKRKMILLIFLQ